MQTKVEKQMRVQPERSRGPQQNQQEKWEYYVCRVNMTTNEVFDWSNGRIEKLETGTAQNTIKEKGKEGWELFSTSLAFDTKGTAKTTELWFKKKIVS